MRTPTPSNVPLAVASALLCCGLATGCGFGLATAPPADFDTGTLNASWSGPYHRPLSTAPLDAAAPPRQAAARPEREPEQRREPQAVAPRQQQDRAREERAPSPPPAQGRGSDRFSPELAAAYVAAVYDVNETAVARTENPGIVDIYRHAQDVGAVYHTPRPAVGDLVFFHNTFDRNGDGRNNDWYTHVGIVESVETDGTVSFLSYMGGEVTRGVLNLEHPDTEQNGGREVNTRLRTRSSSDPDFTQYLAGELFAGFGSLLGDREEVVVIDNWQPGRVVDLHASRQ